MTIGQIIDVYEVGTEQRVTVWDFDRALKYSVRLVGPPPHEGAYVRFDGSGEGPTEFVVLAEAPPPKVVPQIVTVSRPTNIVR